MLSKKQSIGPRGAQFPNAVRATWLVDFGAPNRFEGPKKCRKQQLLGGSTFRSKIIRGSTPPSHTLQFNSPFPETSPTPVPSPTPSELAALDFRLMHATIFPDVNSSNRPSSTSRSPTPGKPHHFCLSPPRNPSSYSGFESPQRSIPKRARSTKPHRASPAPACTPFTQKIPSFSAARYNASALAGFHATGSTRLEKEGQIARKEIDQLRRLPDSRASTLLSDHMQRPPVRPRHGGGNGPLLAQQPRV